MDSEKVHYMNYQPEPESSGTLFYRCMLCTHVVSPWDLKKHHGCPQCAGKKLKPTNLSLLEKITEIVKHPEIWKWPRG